MAMVRQVYIIGQTTVHQWNTSHS